MLTHYILPHQQLIKHYSKISVSGRVVTSLSPLSILPFRWLEDFLKGKFTNVYQDSWRIVLLKGAKPWCLGSCFPTLVTRQEIGRVKGNRPLLNKMKRSRLSRHHITELNIYIFFSAITFLSLGTWLAWSKWSGTIPVRKKAPQQTCTHNKYASLRKLKW